MSLKDKLMEDLKQALREGDERRKSAIRLAMAAIRNAEIEKRRELDDGELLQIIAKEVKQRRDSIAEFAKAGRQDLIDQEKAELEVLLAYLPRQMTREEIEEAARRVIQEVGATGLSQMGKVMGRLMPQVKGRADGRLVSEVV
ncbi:MAG TPA: GatB/YqeY domain-containing protein, partial [Chloroflexi bacterium]|nr:GatB/YqeY domain-containing protein [Chloroflexota bacterium]